jgi:hypothetical protein
MKRLSVVILAMVALGRAIPALAAFAIFMASTVSVTTQAPVNTALPVINAANFANGTGGALSVSNGTWVNSPTSYNYQWWTELPATPSTSGRITQTNIGGATSASYTPPTCASNCPLYGVTVSASNTAGTGYSIPVQLVGPQPATAAGLPTNTAAPTIGSFIPYGVGVSVMSVSGGTWTNSPVAYSYQWEQSASSTCSSPTVISGAVRQVYAPSTSDEGLYMCVAVTAYNQQGSATATTTTGQIVAASTAVPSAGAAWSGVTISGTPQVGQVLTLPSPSTLCNTFDSYFTSGVNFPVQSSCYYTWYDWNGTTATPISGVTSNSYTVQTSDVGYQIEASVSGSNSFGTGTLPNTAPTATVTTPSAVPANTVLDTIYSVVGSSPCTTTSTWLVGCKLQVTLGTWTNSPLLYSYQWLRNGVAIAGATNYNYTPAAADQGDTISLQVIANNNIGHSTTETTAATGTILETGVPVGSTIPTITGNPVQGGLLTASTGTWTLSPTSYAYQWLRNGTNISGATSQTYTLISADVGNPITVSVLATNSAGTAASALVSNPTANVTNPGGLVASCTVSISGTAEAGAALTASATGCTNSPTSYAYAWSSGGSPVGTNSSTYTLAESDVGNTITVAITPTNAVGTTPPFTSSPTATITNPPAPSGGSVTAITNAPTVGQPATWSTSGWSGLGTITYQYETCVGTWSGTSCSNPVQGWPTEGYVPSSSDIGSTLTYIVIATNLGGSTTAYIAASSTVANPAASTNTTAPVIAGTAEVGNDLVSAIGVWTSTQTQFTFQWCSSGIAHTSACNTGYGPITGATKQVYTLQSSDQGNTIEVGVNAINGAGTVTAFSAPTSAVAAFPIIAGGCNGWASSTFYDGCKGAPPAGPYTVQHANFFSGYAERSGQVYPSGYGCKGNANCHPPWAVAGVDYPVGVSCGSSCGFASPGTATDPTSASPNITGVNPGDCTQQTNTNSNWTASWSSVNGGTATFTYTGSSFVWIGGKEVVSGFSPSGYNGTFINPPIPSTGSNELVQNQSFTVPMAVNPGSFVSAGSITSYGDRLNCNVTTSGGTVSIGPIDFSGNGNPYGQALSFTLTGGNNICIIHDSLIVADTMQSVSSQLSSDIITGCKYLVLRNNLYEVRDTSGAQTPQFPAMWNEQLYVWVSTGSNTGAAAQVLNIPTIQQYNAFVSCPARCTGFAGALSSRFNYMEGLNAYTTTGNGAHGDGIETSLYNGPIGFHTPCYCTGGDIISEKFDTWLTSPPVGSTGTGAAVDCVTCGLINVPEGSVNGWTSGDGILHIVSGSDFYNDFPMIHTSMSNATLVTQCKDAAGNTGCNLKQFQSCSPVSPCEYTVSIPLVACPTNLTIPGQTCAFTYIYPATFDVADVRNNIYANNIINANGSGGQGGGSPVGNGAPIGIFYGDYNNTTIKNNYVDMCGVHQANGNGTWNTGFPEPTCFSPPVITVQGGVSIPAVTLGNGQSGNTFNDFAVPNNPPTQGDNVLMQNGGCLLAFGTLNSVGFQPNPLTDCATVAPP